MNLRQALVRQGNGEWIAAAAVFLMMALSPGADAAAECGGSLVAVTGFRSSGIEHNLLLSLREQVESQLISHPDFCVVSRTELSLIEEESRMRQEKGLQGDSSLIATANRYGVQKLLTGTITTVAGKYAMVLKVIDIHTGQIEHADYRRFTGNSDALFIQAAEAVDKLFGTAAMPPPAPRAHVEPAAAATAAPGPHDSQTKSIIVGGTVIFALLGYFFLTTAFSNDN
jgi:hypothetical protein